jgi:organic hydroperoxide reductase OsmC/OhrA
LDVETAKALADAVENTCPYSKVIRGNMDVETDIL